MSDQFVEEYIKEALGTSQVRMDRARKLSMLGGSMAVRIAKERNDPLYKKYEKFRDLFMKTKQQIQQKYGSKGAMAARQAAMKSR